MKQPAEHNEEFIHVYTRQQAIEDGVLVQVEPVDSKNTVITSNLYSDGYEDEAKRETLLQKGQELLKIPDEEDTDTMLLRVIEAEWIWVIEDGDGICFLRPEDY